jgi:uncharacterized protein
MSMARRIVPPLISGALFGAGLAVGGMTDPERVRGFLDLFGSWDPTLAFVMGGAVVVMAIAWRLQARMKRPIFGERFALPDRSDIDTKLIAGSALFGIGWGIAGLCPGPAVASLGLAPADALPFVAAMLAGMALHRIVSARTRRAQPQGI